MSGSNLTQLIVLGTAAADQVSEAHIVNMAKSFMPKFWSPTTDVIHATILSSLQDGFLGYAVPTLLLTPSGRMQFNKLLLAEHTGLSTPSNLAFETAQLCFLDVADSPTLNAFLTKLSTKIDDEINTFQERVNRCPHIGKFTQAWIDVEIRRLENIAALVTTTATNIEMAQFK